MQHQVVAVGIGEERHVADPGVEGVAGLRLLVLGLFPRSKDRGLIEGQSQPSFSLLAPRFPRSKDRGLIEGDVLS